MDDSIGQRKRSHHNLKSGIKSRIYIVHSQAKKYVSLQDEV